ncbi:MAG: SprT family zinc-dependent metalloprotease [Phenylobacterium sp.]|uniref:M48 family metallopeptidase n=1 Tax=Phenylobacterium sp. TaxID=1871053 RepID=UPI002723A08A|nr:SprT family zinc-dependent metalloprotease [Phenylobacterium sp.]MDO8902286.1 SprT family zinc-dependent metalloprotease [Phenylobacterium sp.]
MSPFGRIFADGDRIEIAGAVIRLKVHPRARRISLRLDRSRREVVATAPSPRRLGEAAAFARDRIDWISARLDELPTAQPLAPGVELLVLGEAVRLIQGEGRARFLPAEDALPVRLSAPGEGAIFARSAQRLLRRRALEGLTALTQTHVQVLGAPMPQIALTDARSRWGSCKPASPGRSAVIRYSWRLALAPLAVADYVAAHECAHLRELNHGPQFWALVRGLVGDPTPHRAWLRTHGARLHAVGADDAAQ